MSFRKAIVSGVLVQGLRKKDLSELKIVYNPGDFIQ